MLRQAAEKLPPLVTRKECSWPISMAVTVQGCIGKNVRNWAIFDEGSARVENRVEVKILPDQLPSQMGEMGGTVPPNSFADQATSASNWML